MRSFYNYESDKRIQKAKNLIFDYLNDEKQLLNNSETSNVLDQSYSELLDEFTLYRGAPLFFPYLTAGISDGPKVRLANGSIKYDMINGIGVHPGHHLPLFFESSWRSLFVDTVMQGNLQQHYRSVYLSKLLCQSSKMDHCFLTTSGAMATENALKMMFQKHAPAHRLLAFEHCFIGRTLGLASITDKAIYRDGLPTTLSVDYVPFYNPKNKNSLDFTIQHIDAMLNRYPSQHAGMCMELIQGEGGYNVGTSEFFNGLVDYLHSKNICVFVDEIQTFGRTQEMYAHHYFELINNVDIVTIGKLSQVCATLFSKHYAPRPGLISQTFTGSTSAIESAILLIEELSNGNYYGEKGEIVLIHKRFLKHFNRLKRKYPLLISGPYGHGGMIACTLFNGDRDKTLHFLKTLFKNGVIGFICGSSPTRIRFIPPILCCNSDTVNTVMEIFEQTLVEVS